MSDYGKHAAKSNEHEGRGRAAAAAAVLIVLLLTAVYSAFLYLDLSRPEPETWSDAFIAGAENDVPVYQIGKDDEGNADSVIEKDRLTRGIRVRTLDGSGTEVDGVTYSAIDDTGLILKGDDSAGEALSGDDAAAADDETAPAEETAEGEETEEKPRLYVKSENLSASSWDLVQEAEVYVRTPVTIYAEESGPAIASFAAKGSCLRVTGYDRLLEDGSVYKYKVAYGEGDDASEGYVYRKYVVDTQEKADAVFNDNGIYDKVKKDNYSSELYGGKASHLDYYPYERPSMEGHEFCADARAMYLNCRSAAKPDDYIKIIKKTDCNAVVVDIKDGVLAYRSEVAREISPTSYENAAYSVENYIKGIEKLRSTGVYLIGRIVVFNDPLYAEDHPEDCIRYEDITYWPSAYSRDVWEYNVGLALEAVNEFGFNEIQFDYVRFPDDAYAMSKSGRAKFRNKYNEEKGQAIQNFCLYAADQIHEAGAYFSVDVFGESAYGYMTAYGQYWPGISNIVDAISAMPYTDHLSKDAWKQPYDSVYAWAKKARKRQKYLDDPAVARTWITGYNTPYWSPEKTYGEKEMKEQIKALEDAGLKGGFIPWNAANDLSKYKKYKAIWNRE